MEKITAFFAKISKSLTVGLLALGAILMNVEPFVKMLGDIVGQVSPGKAAIVVSVLGVIGRLRTLLQGINIPEPPAQQPKP